MGEFIFGTTLYTKLLFYWIGWKWGYAIMNIIDDNGEYKVRLAKCKIDEDFPDTSMYEWEEVPVRYVTNLSQVNKINFKQKDDIQLIFEVLAIEFEKLKSKR